MADPKKKNKFLNLPRFTGGKKAYAAFLQENLKYPQEAMDAGIEGKVFVEFEIDDNGLVHNARVIKGIGFGCDEEAIRIVSLMRYEKVNNKGVRVKINTKTTINFHLPSTLTYTVTPSNPKPSEKKESPQVTYGYTISF